MTPTKAARLGTTINTDAMTDEEAVYKTLKDTLKDIPFCDLIVGLVRQHETVWNSRDEATTTVEEQKAKLEKNEADIRVLQDQKSDLEGDKGTLVMERDAAAVLARDQATVANEKHRLQLEKAEALIKSLQDQKAEW